MKWKQTFSLTALIVAVTVFSIGNGSASALTPPDTCFDFNTTTGTIVQYFSNENNDLLQPACPMAVDIPSQIQGVTVSEIASSAFGSLGLTEVSIPSSVHAIGPMAFFSNAIQKVTLNEGLQNIGFNAFGNNLITDISVPTTVLSITAPNIGKIEQPTPPGTSVFGPQGPGAIEAWSNIPFYADGTTRILYQADLEPSLKNVWYLRVHLADPTNPRHFGDNINFGQYMTDTLARLPGQGFVLGGDIVNPASITTHYLDQSNKVLAAEAYAVGQHASGAMITTYFQSDGPQPAIPLDTSSPTQNELNAVAKLYAAYFRIGGKYSLTAQQITGYSLVTPKSPADFTPMQAQSHFNFVYSTPSVTGTAVQKLADTGNSTVFSMTIAGTLIIISLIVMVGFRDTNSAYKTRRR